MRLIFENARMKKLYEPAAKERQRKAGGDKKSKAAKSVVPNSEQANKGRVIEQVASAVNVGKQTVANASTVIAALKHPNGAKKSDRQIAEHVGVSAPMVSKHRAAMAATVKDLQSPERTGRDGRTINTANIGKRVEVEAEE